MKFSKLNLAQNWKVLIAKKQHPMSLSENTIPFEKKAIYSFLVPKKQKSL